ncbi:MAG TPA: high-potential iron-sulfur protein [Pararobbsia sp.]|jgi:hypothetical protein|nr:high-potential iron-sulfur protein [Pararobbsia sp.]
MKASRRSFLIYGASAGTSLALSRVAQAQSPVPAQKVSPSDADAVKLGYVEVATQVDKARSPNYSTGQDCSNCSLYQGKDGEAYGGCTLFGNRLVAAHGWCASYSSF